MTEQIKLPPLPDTEYSLGIPSRPYEREWISSMEAWDQSALKAYARLAVEQATADLRAELAAMTSRAESAELAVLSLHNSYDSAYERAAQVEAERDSISLTNRLLDVLVERDEARAELARLTTLRQCWCQACDVEHHGFRTRMSLCPECGDKRCPRSEQHDNPCSTTPLPPVKEADK